MKNKITLSLTLSLLIAGAAEVKKASALMLAPQTNSVPSVRIKSDPSQERFFSVQDKADLNYYATVELSIDYSKPANYGPEGTLERDYKSVQIKNHEKILLGQFNGESLKNLNQKIEVSIRDIDDAIVSGLYNDEKKEGYSLVVRIWTKPDHWYSSSTVLDEKLFLVEPLQVKSQVFEHKLVFRVTSNENKISVKYEIPKEVLNTDK